MIFLLMIFTFVFAEQAPEAEYPYPKRSVAEDSEGFVEQPIRRGNRGEYYYDTGNKAKRKQPYRGVEKPYRVGSDGSYYYDTGSGDKEDKEIGYEGVERPIDSDSRGGYYYQRKKKNRKTKSNYGPKPAKINTDGSYIYNTEIGETRNTFYLRGGVMGSPEITSGTSTFDSVYGSGDNFLLTFEYDWLLASNLFLKLGSGFTSTEGQGRFEDGREARETFQFYVFPNTLSLAYKLQIADIQYLTPYVEGGAGYFTFIENRSDGDIFSFDSKTTKYGGAFVATATGGLLISLSKFSSGTSLRTDYGATQSWIDIQYKQVFGLDKRKDFSSNMITGGFAIGF